MFHVSCFMIINLLPSSEKKTLQKEKHYKIVLILEMTVLCFLVCFCLILFSIKIYISGQAKAEKILFNLAQKELQISEIQKIEENIKTANQNLIELNSFYKSKTEVYALFEKISKLLPSGVYFTNLSLRPCPEPKEKEEEKKCEFQVSISGFAPARERLYELRQILESQQEFKEIYLPPSNWAKPFNIDFHLTFKI